MHALISIVVLIDIVNVDLAQLEITHLDLIDIVNVDLAQIEITHFDLIDIVNVDLAQIEITNLDLIDIVNDLGVPLLVGRTCPGHGRLVHL